MAVFQELRKGLLISLWFVFLTFPVMVIKVDPIARTVNWRWMNMVYMAIGTFVVYNLVRLIIKNRERGKSTSEAKDSGSSWIHRILDKPILRLALFGVLAVVAIGFPQVFSTYQTNVMTTALMYVVLGLGLNIVVGLAGLLDLGFVAFYAVGAYTYALLNHHFGLGFWTILPLGGLLGALFGIILGFPVLRLRGDYLAIVTLAFGEIIRLVLENWGEFTKGPSGVSSISRPSFFGVELDLHGSIVYNYYIMVIFVIITIFVVNRLQNSRLGRAWIALREDEIACQAMGIDKHKTKLTAFSLGAFWAGLMGVVFAGKTTFVNPASFTFMESAIILAIVVLGGMGSIVGVILGALFLILMPEYLRELSQYRMLAFGAILVCMMIFRPQGLIANIRRTYVYQKKTTDA